MWVSCNFTFINHSLIVNVFFIYVTHWDFFVMIGSWVSPPRFSSPHFERLWFTRSLCAPFILPSYAEDFAQAYCSVISDSSSDHSRCPRYDTRVKAYLDLSAFRIRYNLTPLYLLFSFILNIKFSSFSYTLLLCWYSLYLCSPHSETMQGSSNMSHSQFLVVSTSTYTCECQHFLGTRNVIIPRAPTTLVLDFAKIIVDEIICQMMDRLSREADTDDDH